MSAWENDHTSDLLKCGKSSSNCCHSATPWLLTRQLRAAAGEQICRLGPHQRTLFCAEKNFSFSIQATGGRNQDHWGILGPKMAPCFPNPSFAAESPLLVLASLTVLGECWVACLESGGGWGGTVRGDLCCSPVVAGEACACPQTLNSFTSHNRMWQGKYRTH